ncbi:MAG: HlyD family efflux transporter periplasmic adaptor subunit [Phycisphaerales bacterium]|nr:HlyD family efflux transporter periplasmic adaptor subunit [Phycisphaerales bacterium]
MYSSFDIRRPLPTRARGLTASGILGIVILIAILVVMGLIWMGAVETGTTDSKNDIHNVARGDFMISIPASGELSANKLVEIRNPLETRGIIMEIVGEGTSVKKGDVLVRFNQDELEQRIKDDEDKLVDAQNKLITEEQALAIAMSTMKSELDKAKLNIEIAELALRAWTEGDHIKMTQTLNLAVETAKINSDRLTNRFEEAKDLVDQGFISRDEYERDRISMIESAAKVKQATLDLEVYAKYTSKQDEKTKLSDVDQTIAEKSRVEQRHKAEMVTQRADVATAKKRVESMEERLADLKEQLGLCTIIAPTDGLVVYKTSLSSGRWGRNDDNPPNVGTDVSPNELVILLPDTNQMIANVKVSEALSGRIREGQEAVVYSEAHPNTPIRGTVQTVSVLAESGGWRDPNRRDYTVRIVLDVEPGMELKPSMRCRSEIQLGKVENAISVPIQSVYRAGRIAFVYVPDDDGWSQRQVKLGRSSELAVEVIDGVEIGETVLLREPDPMEIVSRINMEDDKGKPGNYMPGGGPPKGAGGKPANAGGSTPPKSGRPPASVTQGKSAATETKQDEANTETSSPETSKTPSEKS